MMKDKIIFSLSLLCFAFSGKAQAISAEAQKVQSYIPENAVIAHRGTIYWAPELTEASFRWARNTGADYLELDVQRSKDGVLFVMHDRTFNRTTDVAQKFPGREKDKTETFTFEEIMKLDAGSKFNELNPKQARASFKGLNVLALEDVFRIAEGKRIKRNPDGSRAFRKDAEGKYIFEYEPDPADNGNRPGVFIETKKPEEFTGLEEQIYSELARMGWNPLERGTIDEPYYLDGKVNIGHTKGKILIQTFSRQGMQNLKRVFKNSVPTSFLVSNPKTNDFADENVMNEIVRFTVETGAQFIGTNLGETNDGLTPVFSEKIHAAGLRANVYSFNTVGQMEKYSGKGKNTLPLLNGMITNRADLSIHFYYKNSGRKLDVLCPTLKTLKKLGYTK